MVRLSDETLVAGLRELSKLEAGKVPSEEELSQAPHLSNWVFGEIDGGFRRLGGIVTGHPRIRDGWIWTSVVLFVSPDKKWARTVSRYYNLGDTMQLDGD